MGISRVGIEQGGREEEEERRRRGEEGELVQTRKGRGMWAAGRGKPNDCGAKFEAKKFPWQKAEG